MSKKSGFAALLFVVVVLAGHAVAATKHGAQPAVADDFQKQAYALSTVIANLNKMQSDASPHDAEMLRLITNQMALVGVNVDGVATLSQLAAPMRNAQDLGLTRKYLAAHCEVLLKVADPTVTYVKRVAEGVAAVAINAEIEKVSELTRAIGRHAVCTDKNFNPLVKGL